MQSDVERFFADVDQLCAWYPTISQAQYQAVQHELTPLQFKSQSGDLCGRGSFFEKMLPRVLDGEQLAKYQTLSDQRRRQRYLVSVEASLVDLDDRIGLNSKQHDAIRRLLIEQPVPRSVEMGGQMGQLDLLIMYRLAKLSADKLEPLFDERQWKAFDQDRAVCRI